ncbi:UNVERIFIED_CONTAM: hypothetical protein GTU68_062107 [Idotea baltica]|nr:hypothetical protein [Idotea baltica]
MRTLPSAAFWSNFHCPKASTSRKSSARSLPKKTWMACTRRTSPAARARYAWARLPARPPVAQIEALDRAGHRPLRKARGHHRSLATRRKAARATRPRTQWHGHDLPQPHPRLGGSRASCRRDRGSGRCRAAGSGRLGQARSRGARRRNQPWGRCSAGSRPRSYAVSTRFQGDPKKAWGDSSGSVGNWADEQRTGLSHDVLGRRLDWSPHRLHFNSDQFKPQRIQVTAIAPGQAALPPGVSNASAGTRLAVRISVRCTAIPFERDPHDRLPRTRTYSPSAAPSLTLAKHIPSSERTTIGAAPKGGTECSSRCHR